MSADRYGRVALPTQDSMNVTMTQYLKDLDGKEVYYIQAKIDRGNRYSRPEIISYDQLLKRSHGSDPFKIPDQTNLEDSQDLRNLKDAGFCAGFKLVMGLPTNYDAESFKSLPNIVDLDPRWESMVNFRMICADIKVAQWSSDSSTSWSLVSQSDQPNRVWTWKATLNLRTDTDRQRFDDLLPAAKEQQKNLSGSMFDVSQVRFDLENATLREMPNGISFGTDAEHLLATSFIPCYFGAIKAKGSPVLQYTVAPRA